MPTARLQTIARSPLLLVATDFDGTISALASSPEKAKPDSRCIAALARLARLACTSVAVVSGRSLDWLRTAADGIPNAMYFGSHGAEEDGPGSVGGEHAHGELLAGIAAGFERIAGKWEGCLVEKKPFSIALHYRLAQPDHEAAILLAANEVAAAIPQAAVRLGSKVFELCATHKNKGDAMHRAKYRAGASHMVFIGDDVTDEDAFAVLGERDISIKVGDGPTKAAFSVAGLAEVAAAFETLADERERWLRERGLVPIQNHSILSDQRALAILTPDAVITWLCLPRIDSPAVFASLLGGAGAGYFAIAAEDGSPPSGQTYLSDSLVLKTSWPLWSITDYLDCSGGRAFQRAGRSDLVRIIEGRGRIRITFAPRLDFGRVATSLKVHEVGLELVSGNDPCVLHSPGVQWQLVEDGQHHTAHAIVDLESCGGSIALELRYGTANLRASAVPEHQRREQTQRQWSGWVGALRVPAEFRSAMLRSALTLRALTNGPTGSIVAAASSSLPEQLGGERNWDYRFCWPRDAAMAATALLRLGNTGHAMKLTEWLVGIVDRIESPERLRPIYTVRGEDLGPEAEIGSLCGYGDSRPVRVGNAAAQQVQLDVFGPIVDMVASMTERGVAVSPDAWRLVRAMVRAVEARWEEPDHGIWEIRGPRRHHVHSKVMCWKAVNRALVVHDAVLGRDNPEWTELRDRIAADILTRGWNERAKAFTGCYECSDVDAAALTLGLCGLLPHSDPRWFSTVEVVEARLRDRSAVYRYRCEDGLAGSEGGFVICACWLVEALVTIGQRDDAHRLFESILAQAGPTGLFAEQWDPVHGIALGNFPQAYSHLGVINAALSLSPS